MFLLKPWSKDLNVVWWKLTEGPGVVILRPTWRVAAVRLLVTFLFWLVSAGWIGVDYEMRQMVERRRFDVGQLADMEQRARAEGDRLRKAGKPEEAAEAERSMRAFTANIVRKRDEELARTEAGQRPWRALLMGVAAVGFWIGLVSPLSVLWQRVRIAREGPDLVVRIVGVFPRSRRIGAAAAMAPEATTRAQMDSESSSLPVMSFARGVRYRDGTREIIFWVKATREHWQEVREGQALSDAIKRVAG